MGNPMNILSMDGGNGLNTALLLTQMESASNSKFLDNTDIFAGTSAGGINALFFAGSESPTAALADLKTFWNNVNRSILEGLESEPTKERLANPNIGTAAKPPDIQTVLGAAFGLSSAAIGARSLFLNGVLKEFLRQRFGNMRLGDLQRFPVVIVTLKLDDLLTSSGTAVRSWGPKLYTNLPHNSDVSKGTVTATPNPDLNEPVVDVAMRTSAAPLELPIYQSYYGAPGQPGFVDGGLVANNPSMITLASIVGSLAQGTANQQPQPATETLKDITMLSVGTGRNLIGSTQYLEPEFTDGSAAWGYQKWLFDPANPMVLIDMFFQGGNESVAFQSRLLLGETNFHRVNVPIKGFLVPDDSRTAAAVANAYAWLRQSAWQKQIEAPAAIPLRRVN
ncbi:MAG: patatin-like phospholipase family protein [Acidobacteriaceae bacterium]